MDSFDPLKGHWVVWHSLRLLSRGQFSQTSSILSVSPKLIALMVVELNFRPWKFVWCLLGTAQFGLTSPQSRASVTKAIVFGLCFRIRYINTSYERRRG